MESKDKLTQTSQTKIEQKHTVGLSGLHARIAKAKLRQASLDPNQLPNRIALLCDGSTSMEYGKIDKLIEACCSFVDHCDPSTTSLALREFPARRADNPTLPLTCDYALLRVSLLSMQASGSTPLADAMLDVLTGVPVTRGVIVSDGEADSAPEALDAARRYREADIPVDCVHIGASASGEDTLKQIAEITGGVYIKFTDIHKFSGAFKYLTPGLYGMLTAGAISADELGAKELK